MDFSHGFRVCFESPETIPEVGRLRATHFRLLFPANSAGSRSGSGYRKAEGLERLLHNGR
jgi:hypothetical protein